MQYPGTSALDSPWHIDTGIPRSPSSAESIDAGTFVTFQLDIPLILELLAKRLPSDLEVYKAVSALPVRRYIGLVTRSDPYYPEEEQAEENDTPVEQDEDATTVEHDEKVRTRVDQLTIHFVSDCTPPETQGLEALHMRISPASSVSDNILALKTNELFPHKDSAVWTTFGARLCVRQFHRSSLRFSLADGELERFDRRAGNDFPVMRAAESNSNEVDRAFIEKMQVPPEDPDLLGWPVQVWEDVREADGKHDPAEFIEIARKLDRYVIFACFQLVNSSKYLLVHRLLENVAPF